MKNWRKVVALVLVLAMVFALAACGEKKTPEADPAETTTPEVSEVTPDESEPEEEPVDAPEEDPLETPREETIYFGGMQWEAPTNMNPLSANPNFFVMEQSDYARIPAWETLYMYNLLTNEIYPLLASGDPEWNADRTVMTIKLNADAKWNDGTAFTSADVVATWDTHVKFESPTGIDYAQYIDSVTATDEHTVEFKAKDGDNYNPLKLTEFLPRVYMMQKDYIEKIEEQVGGDQTEFKNYAMWDAVVTGPYFPVLYDSEQKVVLERDDDYWGQAESMWGKLPVPKYLVHNIYSGNDTSATAFEAGNIDINQQYLANLQDLWLVKDLPISTYLDEAPYQIGAGMPSINFNNNLPGLDQKVVRQAIAYAVDYDQIVSAAMTGQSATFDEYPRCLFNPTEGERALIKDPAALEPYQWDNKDIARANQILDEAGIVDTNNDGTREYNGEELKFKIQCPTGWTDWEAGIQMVAAAGPEIGIGIEPVYPESPQHFEDIQTGNYEIAMMGYSSAGVSNPWTRVYQTMYGFGGNHPDVMTFNYSRFYNAEADELINKIPSETDEEKIKDYYERLNIIYLDEIPALALMYRPAVFHEVNESVWTNYPSEENNAGKEVPIPPQCGFYGYGISALYELELV